MSPIKTKSGAPNYKGLYQATQKTLAEEREKIVELNTDLKQAEAAYNALMHGNVRAMSREGELLNQRDEAIQQNKTMFKYVVSMAVITILVLVWGFVR